MTEKVSLDLAQTATALRASGGGTPTATKPKKSSRIGYTPTNEAFYVPSTSAPLALNPLKMSVFDLIKNSSLLNLVLVFLPLPKWFYVVYLLFWRLMYNCGIGVLLFLQSKNGLLTRMMETVMKKPNSKLYRFLKWCSEDGMEEDYCFDTSPACFNAWMPFRRLTDFILHHEFLAYCAFFLSNITIPDKIGFVDVIGYIAGLSLGFFAIWAKVDAFRVVKDYAWYWGDFFFLVNESLTFDRVFRIAPHPMYTMGYAFIYGAPLLSHTYVVFYVGMLTHISQLIFLALVETPHMKKIYPELLGEKEKERQERLYDKDHGYFSNDLVIFRHFNFFRASDILVAIIVIQCIVFHLVLKVPPTFCVLEVVFWRLFHGFGLGYILKRQSVNKWWENRCAQFGMSKKEAFNSWKGLYNMSWSMTYVSFIFCTYELGHFTGNYYFFRQIVGAILVILSVFGSHSCYEDLGDFGWFYGDFFIDEIPTNVYYSGMYRFLDNPDAVVGFACFYGMALFGESWKLFFLALFSQFVHLLFVVFVEQPHMKKMYKDDLRPHNGIRVAVTDIFNDFVEKNPKIKKLDQNYEKLKARIFNELLKNEDGKPKVEVVEKVVRWMDKVLNEEKEKTKGKAKEKLKTN